MNSQDAALAMIQAVEQALVAETSSWVEGGAAELVLREESGDIELCPTQPNACAVTVVVQSGAEVSFFPTAPGTERTPSIDVYDEDPDRLLDEVRRYARAFLAGRVEMTLRQGSSAGRVRLWLDDGRTETHLYNVVFGFLVGRRGDWDTFRPSPY